MHKPAVHWASVPCSIAVRAQSGEAMPFMPTSHIEPGSTLLRGYRTPFKGMWRTLPAHLLPDDVLYDGHNIFLDDGALRSRAGFLRSGDVDLQSASIGSFLFIDSMNVKYPIVATTDEVLLLTPSQQWNIITPPGYSDVSRDSNARFTSIETNNEIILIMVHPERGIYLKHEQSAAMELITDTIKPIDCCTAATRIILAIPPYTIRWSNSLDPSIYQDSSLLRLADTEDSLVAIRQLGTLGFVVYKEGSKYLVISQSGSDAFAFRPEYYGESEGPASANAIVQVNDSHYYITPSGRIALFNGSSFQWISDALWPFLRKDIDLTYIKRCFALYNYPLQTVSCYYPRRGDNGAVHGIVTINLPHPEEGIATHSAFTGSSLLDLCNGLSVRLFQNSSQPLFFASFPGSTMNGTAMPAVAQGVYISTDTSFLDHNMPFLCAIQPGLTPSPQAMIYKPYIEIQALRNDDLGIVDIYQVYSHLLEEEGGIVDDIATNLDLTIRTVAQYLGFTIAATFLSLRLEWLSDARFTYYGVDLYGRQTV